MYCRFIQTAYYVADQISSHLHARHQGLRVSAVTGNDGDSEQRKETVLDLAQHPARVLVATDCLSEGVNLQEHYDAVVHYDLPWNPNRLEQRDGRVDRFGQNNPTIKTVLLYGSDNEVDQVVMEVLLRKAKTIRERLGINVPVPVEAEQVVNTLVDNVLLRARGQGRQAVLPLQTGTVSRLHETWDLVADQEEETRAYFAQHGIEPDAVARELRDMEPVLGTAGDIRRFLTNALQRFNGELSPTNQAGGPIGKICEIAIELPDYTTRKYRRSTSRKRNKKGSKTASKATSSTKAMNSKTDAKQSVKTAEMKPKRTRGKSTPQPSKPESQRAAHKRSRENAKKLQMPLF